MNARARYPLGARGDATGAVKSRARTDAPATTPERLLIALLAAALAVIAFRGALDYGFSQDDFLSLGRVRGLAPRLTGPWRILANQWFWDAGVRLFGLEARPFHAVVLGAHAASAALLAWLLSRRFPAPAAGLAACLWAVHPSHYMALYWASANSEPFMTLFVLLATAAYFARGPRRALSPVAFAIALAWKESALPLPFALAALALLGPPPRAGVRDVARDPVLWALLAVSLAWGAGISTFVRGLNATSTAYGADFGAVGRNLLAYAAWTPTWMGWLTRDASDGLLPVFARWGAAVLAAALAGLAWRPWRERGAAGALLAALLLLAPVLPLAHHQYHYYLLAPLAAVAVAGAALFASLTDPLAPRLRWAAAAGVVTPLAFAAIALIHDIETAPFRAPGSRAEGTVDRALIATHAIADLRRAALPAHARLRLWSPEMQEMALRTAGSGPRTATLPIKETYEEVNVRSALLEGLALRVMTPAVDSAVFVRAFARADTTVWWAIYRWDGHLRAARTNELARVMAAAGR